MREGRCQQCRKSQGLTRLGFIGIGSLEIGDSYRMLNPCQYYGRGLDK